MPKQVISSFLLTLCLLFSAFAALAADPDPLGSILAPVQGGAPAANATGTTRSPIPQLEAQPLLSGPTAPQFVDYAANLKSDVFGANLFTGAFARQGATQFNPDYAVAIGDKIQLRLWGAFEFDAALVVDPKGNIFIPNAGPVQVLGVRNQDLQRLVEAAVAKVFRANVFSYATLAAAQPVQVFVGGFVNRPGLYGGTSMDSLLHYLDQAGGIDPERGSFLGVQVKRGQQVRVSVNLYDFLLNGSIPLVQLATGDVIFVAPRQNTIKVIGLAENAKRFEFAETTRTVADLARMAKPRAAATHGRVIRNSGAVRNVEYYPLADAAAVVLTNGDELEFTADKKPGTISVRVEGEHQSAQEYVLPYGTRMGELLRQIQFSERSDRASLQLFRTSVKDRQQVMLQTSLRSLETMALTARSGTSDEARLRKDEAELILQWVDRAKKIQPLGQVTLGDAGNRDNLLLENGDVIRVPTLDGLVLVSGEVLFPNALAFDVRLKLDDYVRAAGGYTQSADASRVVVSRRDGSFLQTNTEKTFFGSSTSSDMVIRAGDEILVLPRIDVKTTQFWRDMTQIIYQIAVSAKIIFGL